MGLAEKIRQFVNIWPELLGFGRCRFHVSIGLSLIPVGLIFFAASLADTSSADFRSAALTLPVLWLVSVTMRTAVQQFVLNDQTLCVFLIGPTGNLTTDYEGLAKGKSFSYLLSGQLATISIALVGMIGAIISSPVPAEEFGWMQALDFRGGWTVAALASQLMWVNLFLAGLHSLPAVPFDARAGLHAIVKAHLHAVDQSVILRRMSLFQSHLATCLLGAGLTLFIASLIYAHELLWGCGLMATAIYLLFSSRWELSRACELESDFVPFQARITRRDGPAAGQPGPHRRAAGVKAKSSHSEGNAESEGIPSEPPALDVDDILRKLHRDGRESLSSVESEALISASRELQRKRGTAGK